MGYFYLEYLYFMGVVTLLLISLVTYHIGVSLTRGKVYRAIDEIKSLEEASSVIWTKEAILHYIGSHVKGEAAKLEIRNGFWFVEKETE